jgi:hypothetical protein
VIEQAGFFGGMATLAQVPTFCPYSDGQGPIVGGIGLEVLRTMQSRMWDSGFQDGAVADLDWIAIDPEVLKRVLDDVVFGSGAEVLFYSTLVAAHADAGQVTAIDVVNKGGVQRLEANIFVDCTGDADLVAMAGGEYEMGDEEKRVQAVTLCFRVAGVDVERYRAYRAAEGEDGNLRVAVQRARDADDFPFEEKNVASFKIQSHGVAGLNFGHVYNVDPLNPQDLTRGEREARAQIPALTRFLQKWVPGLEQCEVVSSGPRIGVRESRRIIGEYRLTKQDYLQRASFPDSIGRYSYPIDIHAASPRDILFDESQDDYYRLVYKPGESYSVPFRAMLPKGLRNVVVAGRTLSADRAMHGSFRVMPSCYATGEAAGTAAALATSQSVALRDLNIERLRETLASAGAIL